MLDALTVSIKGEGKRVKALLQVRLIERGKGLHRSLLRLGFQPKQQSAECIDAPAVFLNILRVPGRGRRLLQ
ncbi:hypothetical protein D3C73_1396490 [compost metagenome]